jgi:hypothetical protein
MNNYGHLFPSDQERIANGLDDLHRRTAVGVVLGFPPEEEAA